MRRGGAPAGPARHGACWCGTRRGPGPCSPRAAVAPPPGYYGPGSPGGAGPCGQPAGRRPVGVVGAARAPCVGMQAFCLGRVPRDGPSRARACRNTRAAPAAGRASVDRPGSGQANPGRKMGGGRSQPIACTVHRHCPKPNQSRREGRTPATVPGPGPLLHATRAPAGPPARMDIVRATACQDGPRSAPPNPPVWGAVPTWPQHPPPPSADSAPSLAAARRWLRIGPGPANASPAQGGPAGGHGPREPDGPQMCAPAVCGTCRHCEAPHRPSRAFPGLGSGPRIHRPGPARIASAGVGSPSGRG